jgi:hypothetical protein
MDTSASHLGTSNMGTCNMGACTSYMGTISGPKLGKAERLAHTEM